MLLFCRVVLFAIFGIAWIMLLSVQYIQTFYLSEVGQLPPGDISAFSLSLTIFTAVAFVTLSFILVVEQRVVYVGLFYLISAVIIILFGCAQLATTVILCRRMKELERKLYVFDCADKLLSSLLRATGPVRAWMHTMYSALCPSLAKNGDKVGPPLEKSAGSGAKSHQNV